MFELPEAKRVHRDELYAHSRSATSSPDLDAQHSFLNRFNEYFDSKVTLPAPISIHAEPSREEDGEDEEEALEFRLFAAPAESTPAIARIRVGSLKPENLEPGIVRARPKSYYFQEHPSLQKQLELDRVALSGEQIIEASRQPWTGCNLPWRVIMFPRVDKNSIAAMSTSAGIERTTRKQRKGKKTRIAIRKKLAVDMEKKRIEAIAAQDQELADRMKKSKKNRNKKLRQREKEKVKKAAARTENEITVVES